MREGFWPDISLQGHFGATRSYFEINDFPKTPWTPNHRLESDPPLNGRSERNMWLGSLAKQFNFMNRDDYDKVAYKKYNAYCYLERAELIDKGYEVDFQMPSFEQFVKRLDEDSEFAKIWGYWNFL
jgi:hypothetical protein